MRDRADRGAPVADGRVGDVRRRPGQQRLDPGGGVVVEQCVVPDERSHRHAVPGGLDGVEAGHPVDVHQRGRRREPHGEQREQRLATGEHLGALTLVGEDREGLVEGAGVGVTEGSRFHRLCVPSPGVVPADARRSARPRRPTTGRAVRPRPRHRARARTWRRRPGADPRGGAQPSSPPGPARGRRASATTATIEPSAIPVEGEVVGEGQRHVADADDDARGQRNQVDRVGEVDPVLLPDLGAEQADHPVEDDGDPAEDPARDDVDQRAELGAPGRAGSPRSRPRSTPRSSRPGWRP